MQVLLCYLILLVLPRILLLSPLLLCLLGQNARNITIKPSLNSYTGVLLLKAICHLFSISAPLIIPCVECGSARLPCSCYQFSQILPPLPFSPPIFIPHSINLMSDTIIITAMLLSPLTESASSILTSLSFPFTSLSSSAFPFFSFAWKLFVLKIFYLNWKDLRWSANVEESHIIETSLQTCVQTPWAAGQRASLLIVRLWCCFDRLIEKTRHLQLSQDRSEWGRVCASGSRDQIRQWRGEQVPLFPSL